MSRADASDYFQEPGSERIKSNCIAEVVQFIPEAVVFNRQHLIENNPKHTSHATLRLHLQFYENIRPSLLLVSTALYLNQ